METLAKEASFLLAKKNDQRKLLFWLVKKSLLQQGCNGKLELASYNFAKMFELN
ncbi:MAG: hypothetical protein V4648_07145 [Bacteroidota bacterium]